MYNKLTIIALLVILCTACNHSHNKTSSQNISNNSITYNITNNTIEIKSTDFITHTLNIAYFNKDNTNTKLLSEPYRFIGTQAISLNIDSIIRCSDNRMELSYKFISNSKLPLVIIIDDIYKINFEYNYFQKHREEGLYAKIVDGNAACLVKEENIVPKIEEIKKWLYDNNNYMDDSKINLMYSIYKDLSYKESNNYCLENAITIPIIKDFSGIKYRIKTNMIADYYYLFATDSKSDLDTFIRDVVSDNFQGSLSNTNNVFSCYRSKDKGGLLTMFLIGIDKKWKKQIIPLGLVCIDNKPPHIKTQNETITDDYKNRYREAKSMARLFSTNACSNNRIQHKIENEPQSNTLKNFQSLGFNITRIPNINIRENITVRGLDFYGNTADFEISFSKNVKSITFEYKNVKRKLNLIDKESPYVFRCHLPLNIGDNYIKINAEDKLGNTTNTLKNFDENDNTNLYEKLASSSALFYVEMVRAEKTTTDIDIDLYNDIDINLR